MLKESNKVYFDLRKFEADKLGKRLDGSVQKGNIQARGDGILNTKSEEDGTIDQGQNPGAPGFHLLFAAGKRPSCAAFREFIASQRSIALSHDPQETAPLHLVETDKTPVEPVNSAAISNPAELVWLELLRDGLTFDLEGLAPGPACEFPEIDHRFDLDHLPTAFRFEALRLGLGQHLSGGQATMPVIQGLVGLARDLTHHFEEIQAIVWPPSKSAIGRRFFESITTAWIEGGAFPALGLTAFRETIDGAVQSVGLNYWIGQEVRLEPPLSDDKVAATRLAVRVVNHLVSLGTLEKSERLTAPDRSRLVMEPSKNGKFIRVWRE